MEKSNEALKQWLHRYRDLQLYAGRLWDRLDDLRGRVESARTAHLDGMPHAHGDDADRLGSIAAELEEIEAEAREAQAEATAARREISAAVRQIRGPRWADKREILRLRYIDALRWEDVTERMFGDSQDFWDRAEVYLRRSYRLHAEALEELAQYVPLETGQEMETGNEI